MPVLLGHGIPLLPPGVAAKLTFADHKVLPTSGIVVLAYSVPGGVGPAPRITHIKAAKGTTRKKAASSKRSTGKRRAG